MKQRFARLFVFGIASLAIVLLFSVTLFTPSTLAAKCVGVETTLVDCSSINDATGSSAIGILVVAIQILTGAVGIAAIGALIYAGMLYSSASGDPGQVNKSKEIIRNTIIGLVLYALIALLLNYLIPGGLFDGSTKFGAGGNNKSQVKLSKLPPTMKVIEEDEEETDPGEPDAAPVDKNNNPDSSVTLTIASWNGLLTNSRSKIVAGTKTLMRQVDVLGMQETQSRGAWIKSEVACGSCDYSMYPSSNSQPRKVAIVWNKKKLSVLDKGHFKGGLQHGTYRAFVWIKFKEKASGKVFYVVNTHFPNKAKVKRSDGWYYTNTHNGKAWQQHMRKLVEKVKELQKENLPIFLTGDYNFNYRRDNCKQALTPCKALSKGLQVKSGWEHTKLRGMGSKEGTIRNTQAIIDYVFSWDRSYITYKSMRVLHGNNGWSGSDHKPVGLTVTIGKQS